MNDYAVEDSVWTVPRIECDRPASAAMAGPDCPAAMAAEKLRQLFELFRTGHHPPLFSR